MKSRRLWIRTAVIAAVAAFSGAAIWTLSTPPPSRSPSRSPSGPLSDWRPSPEGAYLSARYAQIKGDIPAAATFYPIALARDPKNPMLLQRAFTFAAIDGHIAAAADYAARLGETENLSALHQLVIVTDAVKNGRLDAAETMLSSLSRQGVNSFVAPILLAWVHYGRGNAEGAYAALEMMETGGPFKSLGPLHRALMEEATGRYDEAASSYERYLALADQPMLRGIQLAGGFFAHHGRRERAEALAADYADRFPESLLLENAIVDFDLPVRPVLVSSVEDGIAELFYGTASYLVHEDIQSASFYIRLALYLRPDFPLAELLMGQMLAEQERFEEARAFFETVAHRVPSLRVPAALETVKTYRTENRGDEALTQVDRLIATDPRNVHAYLERADILRVEGRFVDAAAAYTRALDLIGSPAARHWPIFFGRGVCFERTGRWQQAEADFDKALALQPDQPLVLNYLGYSWVDQGVNLPQAKVLIERALEKRPKDGAIIDSLGWIYYRLGEYEQAVRILEWAVRQLPNDPTINDHLGDAYWMVGREREATFQWTRALSLADDDDGLTDQIATKLKDGLAPPVPIVSQEDAPR